MHLRLCLFFNTESTNQQTKRCHISRLCQNKGCDGEVKVNSAYAVEYRIGNAPVGLPIAQWEKGGGDPRWGPAGEGAGGRAQNLIQSSLNLMSGLL